MQKHTQKLSDHIQTHILAGVYDFDGDDTARARHIWARFNSEYNHPENRQRLPNTQARVAEWLSGLPLHIAFANYEILELWESWTGDTLTEAQGDLVIKLWFGRLAFNLLNLWRAHGINPHTADAQGCIAWPERV